MRIALVRISQRHARNLNRPPPRGVPTRRPGPWSLAVSTVTTPSWCNADVGDFHLKPGKPLLYGVQAELVIRLLTVDVGAELSEVDLKLQDAMLDLGVCKAPPRAEVPRCGGRKSPTEAGDTKGLGWEAGSPCARLQRRRPAWRGGGAAYMTCWLPSHCTTRSTGTSNHTAGGCLAAAFAIPAGNLQKLAARHRRSSRLAVHHRPLALHHARSFVPRRPRAPLEKPWARGAPPMELAQGSFLGAGRGRD